MLASACRTRMRRAHPTRRAAATLAAAALAVALLAGLLAPACTRAVPGTTPQSDDAAGRPRAIIVLIDCATLADVTRADLPGFSAMRAAGSMGLSTIPIGAGVYNQSAYATIAQGTPVAPRGAPPELANAYEASETVGFGTAAEAYARNTGVTPSRAALVDPQIVALAKAYVLADAGTTPGLFAQSIKRAEGPAVALVGDADGSAPGQIDRSASLIAMDAAGTVHTGAVGGSVDVTDAAAPLGRRTDFDRLFSLTQEMLITNTVVVAETGDLQRARVESALDTGAAASAAHERALKATDAYIARVAALANKSTLVLVVATSVPAAETAAGRSLAPVLIAGGDYPAGGALTSPTTRREGLVTLHDIAPTVLAYLGIGPASPMVGLRISAVTDPHTQPVLAATLRRAGALHVQRGAAVNVFIGLQTILLLALCIPWVLRRILGGRRAWWMLPYAAGATALAAVLEPAIGSPALNVALGAIVLIALAIAAVLAALRDRVLALGLLALATLGALALDLAAGAPLARWSFLGYDTVIGGRFYGVGNEFEGVFVGASIVAAACFVALSGRHRKFAVSAVGVGCLGLIAMFALPRLGADAGGALAAAVGVGVTFYGFAGGRFTWKRMALLIGALVALGIVGLGLASALGGGAGSHVGRFIARIAHGDLGFAGAEVLGKLKANLHLLAVSDWRSVFLAAAAAIGVLWWRERAALRAALAAEPDLSRGIAGLIAGGLAVLALNDSGVIAISTLAPFAVLLALTLASRGRAASPTAAREARS